MLPWRPQARRIPSPVSPYRSLPARAVTPEPRRSLYGRIRRLNQKLILKLRGPFLKRFPWPCPTCGNRRTAKEVYWAVGNPHFPSKQLAIRHTCCNDTHHAEKPSTFYRPFAWSSHRN